MSIEETLKYQIVNTNIESETINIKIHDHEEQQMYIIHKALRQQITNNRVRNAHTKTRSEVRGGGKKPWKQKGTGRARAGSNRSPLWRGGGVIFGPRKKVYKSKINKKEKRLAINTLIFNKFKQTLVIQNLMNDVIVPSTKQAVQEIKNSGITLNGKKRLLIAVDKTNNTLYLSFRNIKNVELIEIKSINILSLLRADTILMTQNALKQINIPT